MRFCESHEPVFERYAKDAAGHEHKGPGEGGGQFTGEGTDDAKKETTNACGSISTRSPGAKDAAEATKKANDARNTARKPADWKRAFSQFAAAMHAHGRAEDAAEEAGDEEAAEYHRFQKEDHLKKARYCQKMEKQSHLTGHEKP